MGFFQGREFGIVLVKRGALHAGYSNRGRGCMSVWEAAVAEITKQINRELDLTEFVVTGMIRHDDLYTAVSEFYANEPTGCLLWDFSGADGATLSEADFRSLMEQGLSLGPQRPGGRTALVASEDLEYGLSRMYEIKTELISHPIQYKSCRTREEALQWFAE